MVTQAPEAVYYPGFRYIEDDAQVPIGVLIDRVLDELEARQGEFAARREERP
jgi:hypothetical protein